MPLCTSVTVTVAAGNHPAALVGDRPNDAAAVPCGKPATQFSNTAVMAATAIPRRRLRHPIGHPFITRLIPRIAL